MSPCDPGNRADRFEGWSIDCAAILSEDGEVHSVPRPGRHHDVIALMIGKGYPAPIRGEQGFLVAVPGGKMDGRFVRRVPAKHIARAAGQLRPTAMPLRELFSEDIW